MAAASIAPSPAGSPAATPAHSGAEALEPAPGLRLLGSSIPSLVPVICGALEGTLRMAVGPAQPPALRCRVLVPKVGAAPERGPANGVEEISPAEFERRAGRAQYRKWRLSIRVKQTRQTLKAFFEENGLERPAPRKGSPASRAGSPGESQGAGPSAAACAWDSGELAARLRAMLTAGRPDPAVPEVPVRCGSLRGSFLLASTRVRVQGEAAGAGGEVITPAAFEKRAGKFAFKKWRESIRVDVHHLNAPSSSSTSALMTIGELLDRSGYGGSGGGGGGGGRGSEKRAKKQRKNTSTLMPLIDLTGLPAGQGEVIPPWSLPPEPSHAPQMFSAAPPSAAFADAAPRAPLAFSALEDLPLASPNALPSLSELLMGPAFDDGWTPRTGDVRGEDQPSHRVPAGLGEDEGAATLDPGPGQGPLDPGRPCTCSHGYPDASQCFVCLCAQLG